MKIIADENIPYVKEVFGTLGEVDTLAGRKMNAKCLVDAELLIVRSITRVNRALLEGSRVKFVGTTTIGLDHIDTDYLKSQNIIFAGAPGSNANSVAEYLIASLLVLSRRGGFELAGKTIGVVGVGNVGGRVVKYAGALGMRVLQNDPPLRRKTGEERFLPLEDLFAADIITLHVPLTCEGKDKTYHLAGVEFFNKMKRDSIFINTSRGKVTDEKALLTVLGEDKILAVLDVWKNEPNINLQLLERTAIGTPHIAGYSLEGKVNGTRMVYQAACEFLGVSPSWRPESLIPSPASAQIALDGRGKDEEDLLREAVVKIYDIEGDDKILRKIKERAPEKQGDYFDSLRKNYPVRREFFNSEIVLKNTGGALRRKLSALGFKISPA